MLNLTASMAVVTRAVARPAPVSRATSSSSPSPMKRPAALGPLMGEHHPDVITTDYLLTENGGLHVGSEQDPAITMVVGEKGIAWRRSGCAARQATAPARTFGQCGGEGSGGGAADRRVQPVAVVP